MQTSECSLIKEVPFTINLMNPNERKKIEDLGQTLATKEKLHYEGYIVFTDAPYSVENGKATLFFNWLKFN